MPPWASEPAGISRTNASPTRTSAMANFAGLEGCRDPNRIQSHANSGDSKMTNAA